MDLKYKWWIIIHWWNNELYVQTEAFKLQKYMTTDYLIFSELYGIWQPIKRNMLFGKAVD